MAHACLRGQVHHAGGFGGIENRIEAGFVRDINVFYFKRRANGVDAIMLERRVIVRIEIIQAKHAMALLSKGSGGIRADKASGAGDKRSHAVCATSSARKGSSKAPKPAVFELCGPNGWRTCAAEAERTLRSVRWGCRQLASKGRPQNASSWRICISGSLINAP
jgi:hypothetical protein